MRICKYLIEAGGAHQLQVTNIDNKTPLDISNDMNEKPRINSKL